MHVSAEGVVQLLGVDAQVNVGGAEAGCFDEAGKARHRAPELGAFDGRTEFGEEGRQRLGGGKVVAIGAGQDV